MIFGEAWTGEFSYEEADVVVGGAEEDDGFHVADMCFFLQGEGVNPASVIIVIAVTSVFVIEIAAI